LKRWQLIIISQEQKLVTTRSSAVAAALFHGERLVGKVSSVKEVQHTSKITKVPEQSKHQVISYILLVNTKKITALATARKEKVSQKDHHQNSFVFFFLLSRAGMQ
jgi:hypothetical protein